MGARPTTWCTQQLRWSVSELTRRSSNDAAALGREPAELRESGVAGLPDEAAEKIRSFAGAGCDRIYLQYLDIDDLAHIDVVAGQVLPAV